MRSDDKAAEMSGFGACWWDEERWVATSMNSLAKMVLAGMDESAPSSEDSDWASSGIHEGVPRWRRGRDANEASGRRCPSLGVS